MFVPVRADGPEVFSPRRHEDHEGLLHAGASGPAMKGFWRGPVHGAGKPLWRLPVHRDRASDILPWPTRSPAANTAPRLSRSFLLRVLRAFVVENSGGRVRTPEYPLGEPAVWAGAGGWAGSFFTTKLTSGRGRTPMVANVGFPPFFRIPGGLFLMVGTKGTKQSLVNRRRRRMPWCLRLKPASRQVTRREPSKMRASSTRAVRPFDKKGRGAAHPDDRSCG